MGMSFVIRSYQPQDRETIRWICSETGFMGEPIEVFFEGREIFADLWSRYYLDYEPESCFVAEVEGRVVGYLLGCLDTSRYEQIFSQKINPEIFRRCLREGFFFKRKNLQYVYRVIRSRWRGEFKVPMGWIKAEYPAHLHINIAPPEYRGKGIGKALMLRYLEYLKEHKIPGVHLGTTSRNKRALGLYYHLGFKDLFRGALTCYDHILSEPLELIYLGLKLEG